MLRFAVNELFDASRGAFTEDKSSPPLLDANGVMAQALFRAQQVGGRGEHPDVARRVLGTFGGVTRVLLSESEDAVARAPEAVYYLRAYAQMFPKMPGDEPRR